MLLSLGLAVLSQIVHGTEEGTERRTVESKSAKSLASHYLTDDTQLRGGMTTAMLPSCFHQLIHPIIVLTQHKHSPRTPGG